MRFVLTVLVNFDCVSVLSLSILWTISSDSSECMYLVSYRQNFASRLAEETGSALVRCSSFIARCSSRTDRTSLRLMPRNPELCGRALRVRSPIDIPADDRGDVSAVITTRSTTVVAFPPSGRNESRSQFSRVASSAAKSFVETGN